MASILIVEDDEQVRALAEGFLEELGHTTLTAGNVEEATALLDTNAEIELIFADIGLLDDAQGGLSVAKYAKLRRDGVPVVYTTGRGVSDGMRALFVERHVFLPKPYTPGQLKIATENALKL